MSTKKIALKVASKNNDSAVVERTSGKSEKSTTPKITAVSKSVKKPSVPDEIVALFRQLGVDPRRAYSLGAPRKVFEVAFENEFGKKVLFTVEHPNKLALKDSIADLPVGMRSKKPGLRVVDAPVKGHFSFDEWFQLTALAAPGQWYYLGVPDEYKKAAKIYAKIDPLGRVFG